MRKLLIPLLLASALAPATAYAKDGPLFERRQHSQSERGDRESASESRSSDSRPQRAERGPRIDRSERADRPVRIDRSERADRPARIERVDRSDSDQPAERRFRRAERPVIQPDTVQEVRQVEPVQTRPARRIARDGLLSGVIAERHDGDNDRDRVRDRDRDGSRWRDRNGNWRRWSGDWRHDRRYDWYSYRHRYGSLFRLGRYYDPYRYGYRRFSIGFTLWPSYYGSNYWLDDPWQYRLPPAYGPYRWVRYYDDALLVNIYSGQVVDVIHNFFW